MSLPSSYLTSYKNLPAILDSIQAAQAPERFTVKFLQDLGYNGNADRLVIKMLKTLGLLRDAGEPTQAYFEFLDPSQAGIVIAGGLRSAYSDLFQINRNAQTMSLADVKAKFKTISQGGYTDDVLNKMANTFLAFSKHADWSEDPIGTDGRIAELLPSEDEQQPSAREGRANGEGPGKTRLVYEINIHLPATRDAAVYDALFSSLSKHLDI